MFTTFSYFTDTESSTGNTITVGTWAVDVDHGGSSATQTFQGLVVGDNGTKTWTVKNTGTIPAFVDLNISVAGSGIGQLENYLMADLYVVSGSNIYGDALINGAGGAYNQNLPLAAGESKNINLDWNVNSGYSQGPNDKVVVTINFDIEPLP